MQHVARRSSRTLPPIPTDWLIILILFLGAAALRVWGVHWSLPYVIHTDEPNIVDAGVRIVKSGNPDPQWYHYPSLVIYLQTAVYKLNLLWGTWRGTYVGPESLPDTNFAFALAPDLYEWGRTFTALIGAGVVAAVYGLGRLTLGAAPALVAALLLLTSPVHVEQSHYLVTDIVMGACGLGVLAAAWWLAAKRRPQAALLAGFAVGLCAAAKYNGAYAALVPAIAWGLAWWGEGTGQRLRRARYWIAVGCGMAAMAGAGFLLANPYTVLNWRRWSRGFMFQLTDYQPVSTLEGMIPPLRSYLDSLWTHDTVITVVGVLGGLLLLGAAWRMRDPALRRAAWLLLPFPIFYVVLMSRFERTFERNLVVIMPFLCLAGGYGCAVLIGWLVRRLPPTLPSAGRNPLLLAGLVGVLLSAEPGRQMINFDRYLAGPDSRLLARDWLQQEARAGRRAAVELHPLLTCAPAPWACPLPDIYSPFAKLTDHPPAWYAERGYDYVVLVGKEAAVLEDETKSGPRAPAQLAPYLALPEAAHFAGDEEGGKGPPVFIYRVGPGVEGMQGVTRNGARFGDLAELWGSARAPLPAADAPFDPVTTPPPPPATPYHPGAALGLNLYWRALKDGATVPGNWTVAVHLSNAAGAVVAQVDVQPISSGRLRPVREWTKGEFLAGTYNVPLPATLPPGSYRLSVVLYDAPTGPTLPVTTATGASTPDLDLGTITVTP